VLNLLYDERRAVAGTVGDMSVTFDFDGTVVLVTGGTRGVGRGIAQRFADARATVVVCARNKVDDFPDDWTFLTADVRDGDAAWAMIDTVVERFGHLDALVNNAGGAPPADTTTAPPRFSERVVALNLLAAVYCSQRANYWMQQGDGGSITNISSISGLRPSPTSALYSAAKAGLVNFTMTAAMEWAPKVRVNAVSVGLIRTEQAHLFYGDEEGIARVSATIPMGRLAEPSDVGDVCLFLASPLAAYVSGANVHTHGGGERPPYLEAAAPT
jgi:NAD(P)-dependent dehydrogenase (short-subunit alcohol dehydrogenase family)